MEMQVNQVKRIDPWEYLGAIEVKKEGEIDGFEEFVKKMREKVKFVSVVPEEVEEGKDWRMGPSVLRGQEDATGLPMGGRRKAPPRGTRHGARME